MKLNVKYIVIGIAICWMNMGVAQETSDRQATEEAKELYKQLFQSIAKGTLLGHQDALAYGHDWYGEEGRSDVKDVIGQHPVVVGWELGDLELEKEHNLDKVYFDDMRRYVRETHQRGGLSMFSWHGNNIATRGNAWDCGQDTVVRSILPGGVHHLEYVAWLDRLGDFFLSLTDEQGVPIPVVFRPYHEHTGSWFWWGAKQCTPQEYKALWHMTIRYLQDVKNIHHLLYSYATAEVTTEAQYLERYPGDEVVDIVAFDAYVPNQGSAEDVEKYIDVMNTNLDIVVNYAKKSEKIASIGETGYESIKNEKYFTEIMYPLLKDRPIAWVLFWRNAYETDKRQHFYLPFKGHPASKDFKKFVKKKRIFNTLF